MSALTNSLRASILAGLALALAGPATAAVHYHFDFLNGGPVLESFDYTAANFISVSTTVPVAALDSCSDTFGADCFNVRFEVDSTGLTGSTDIADVIEFTDKFPNALPATGFHYFENGAFGAVGVYAALGLPGEASVLTVTQTSGGVPEPGAWALMLAGFAALGSALRQRRLSVS